MFTGIIEEIGHVITIKKATASATISISANKVLQNTKIGDSIAVNGVCLTVTSLGDGYFNADVMHETLNRSNLKNLTNNKRVNLERAMAAEGRFGGHIVSGHIDATGTVKSIKQDDNAVWYTIKADESVLKYVVYKGSITIDGISLTVAKVDDESFSVSIIPHTRSATTLADRRIGDTVNLENDIIGKYVEKLLSFKNNEQKNEQKSGITMEFLAKNGF